MSFPNNYTYKVAHGISTISRTDHRTASSKTYACEAGASYRSNEEVGSISRGLTQDIDWPILDPSHRQEGGCRTSQGDDASSDGVDLGR